MSEVLRGLYARRADLERRIASAQSSRGGEQACVAAIDCEEQVIDLHLQLKSIVTQIDVYASSADRWGRGA